MFKICKRSTLLIVALLLSIKLLFISASRLRTNIALNEKWFGSSPCYAYDNVRDKNRGDGEKVKIGQNKNTGEDVYVIFRTYKTNDKKMLQNVEKEDYYYYSQEKVDGTKFAHDKELRPYFDKNFYFTYIARTCRSARNVDDKTPKGYKEYLDKDVWFNDDDKCNYNCRTIYMVEKGRCTKKKENHNNQLAYYCTFITTKTLNDKSLLLK